ncbi:LacI family DNA-binding transcriptional regulator [Amycolatopsis circi]|uniref:LacI family DNA-binding transcriptional regulator n=1 Tax=Amycolatopsis circi TaxID=871959 RepID=UPI003CC62E9A
MRGVSRATASLVLRGTGRVSEETRQRVMAAATEFGYVYDRVAASLRTHWPIHSFVEQETTCSSRMKNDRGRGK